MAVSSIYTKIKNTLVEKEIADLYNTEILKNFSNVQITYPFACDGLIETKTSADKDLKLIIEYKYDMNFKSRLDQAKVIVQVLYYLKKFEDNGVVLPNVCMIADKNECFVFHTDNIMKFLDYNINWDIAPSDAAAKNMKFTVEISEYLEHNQPFVFDVNEGFNFKFVADKISGIADNVVHHVRITEHNISRIFEHFQNNVLKSKRISSNDAVTTFIGVMTNPDGYYLHPSKKNTLVTPQRNIEIDGGKFKAFFSQFQQSYSPEEGMKFTAIADRLIEDTERRKTGDFWTPTVFCDYANKMISEELGEDWREKYVVWDPACGTKNLTRDYKFGELYCSTLFENELSLAKDYNKRGVSFQFDFLNDDFPAPNALVNNTKVPGKLIEALRANKPIVFFLNPPYGTASEIGKGSKQGISNTQIKDQMRKDNLGAGAANIQHQFMYRICKIVDEYHLTNVYIALFSNPIYLSGGKSKNFLKFFCNHFEYRKGIMFCAAEFANVSDTWGITFNIWKSGQTKDIHNFHHTLVKRNENNEIVKIGEKDQYNTLCGKSISDWVREPIKGMKTFQTVNLKNAIEMTDTNQHGRIFDKALGYYWAHCNNVQNNLQFVGLFSAPMGDGGGCGINKANFIRCITMFTARKLIKSNWMNNYDEYFVPNETHPDYSKFAFDSVIYSLFESKSQQSSLRNVEYNGKTWNIENNFFFMSKADIQDLANTHHNNECYNDARTSDDRYVYKFIRDNWDSFSDDAKAVYNMAVNLVRESFRYRESFNEDHPEYQINNFDAGWYQIKAMLKAYMPEELKEFNSLYKQFGNRLRPLVYSLGFLKK